MIIAAMVGGAWLLFVGLTRDTDLELVYFVEALLTVAYVGLLGYLGWVLRARGPWAWALLGLAALSLPLAAPSVAGAYERALFEASLPRALWSFGALARGAAHLVLLVLLAWRPEPHDHPDSRS